MELTQNTSLEHASEMQPASLSATSQRTAECLAGMVGQYLPAGATLVPDSGSMRWTLTWDPYAGSTEEGNRTNVLHGTRAEIACYLMGYLTEAISAAELRYGGTGKTAYQIANRHPS